MLIGKFAASRKNPHAQSGAILLGVLVMLLIVGIMLGEAGALWSEARKHDREQELLKVGSKMRLAIGQYYKQTPGPIKQYPRSLAALLKDDRFPIPKRYLRQIYSDPMTGQKNWGVLESPSGGIMGIYSLSGGIPYKVANFRPIYKLFENKKSYGDWIFAYSPELDI
ncbi:type II secretion system protein [Methyloradius palustris]|nr:type II secretion system protein [Methyloradius palustris]